MSKSKSDAEETRLLARIISFLRSNTEMVVPSNVTRDSSFWDLNFQNTEEVMFGLGNGIDS